MIVPSVRVQRRVPGFDEKSLVVTGFETNDLDVFKVHVVAEMVDMACNFGVLVKTCHCLFVLRNSEYTKLYREQLILYIMSDYWRSCDQYRLVVCSL